MSNNKSDYQQKFEKLSEEEQKAELIKVVRATHRRLQKEKALQESGQISLTELRGLSKEIEQELIKTDDYKYLRRQILGIDADIPSWDWKHIETMPKEKLVEMIYLPMEDEISGNVDKVELKKAEKELAEFFLDVGFIDTVQFWAWLSLSDDGNEFLEGPYNTLQEFIAHKLHKMGGKYRMSWTDKVWSWFS